MSAGLNAGRGRCQWVIAIISCKILKLKYLNQSIFAGYIPVFA